MDLRGDVDAAARALTTGDGFPAQEQDVPGSTEAMNPRPDHGETSYRGHGRLEGFRALITGGDSGIGRAVAIAYAREGADVALTYLPGEESDAAETERWVRDAGRKAVLLPVDLRTESAARQAVRDGADGLGGLDVVVNNAAFQNARRTGLADATSEDLDRTLVTNLQAVFWVTQEALPYLSPGSSVINTSSIQAYVPSPKLVDYAATKAALNNVTVNLAADLGPQGIRVNAVAPGPIWTPLQPSTQHGERLPTFGSDTPLGRAGQPAEVAGAFVFLASPREASYVSGTVLGVTGGKPVF